MRLQIIRKSSANMTSPFFISHRYGKRRNKQIFTGTKGMYPGAGYEGPEPPAVPGVEADASPARQFHRRQVPHVYDRHDLARHVFVRALAQHAAVRRPRQGAGHGRPRAPRRPARRARPTRRRHGARARSGASQIAQREDQHHIINPSAY